MPFSNYFSQNNRQQVIGYHGFSRAVERLGIPHGGGFSGLARQAGLHGGGFTGLARQAGVQGGGFSA